MKFPPIFNFYLCMCMCSSMQFYSMCKFCVSTSTIKVQNSSITIKENSVLLLCICISLILSTPSPVPIPWKPLLPISVVLSLCERYINRIIQNVAFGDLIFFSLRSVGCCIHQYFIPF